MSEDELYYFDKLPENIRQMGEQTDDKRIYFEDYVVTYMEQIFNENPQSKIVIYVGGKGEKKAQNSIFIYGAMAFDINISLWKKELNENRWKDIYENISKYFPGAQIMGVGLGVFLENEDIKNKMEKLMKNYFHRNGQVLFYRDMSEETEVIEIYQDGLVKKIDGYYIYYGKNPRMQEFMLAGKKKQSFEAEYKDDVMKSVRSVIRKNETKQKENNFPYIVAGSILALMLILGAGLLFQSNSKIEKLEKSITTLSSGKNNSAKEVDNDNESNVTPKITVSPFASFLPKKTSRAVTKPPVTKPPVTKPPVTKPPVTKPLVTRSPVKKTMVEAKNSYIVKKGDTLGQILMRQYQTTKYMKKVMDLNKIENQDEIWEGQCLILPQMDK